MAPAGPQPTGFLTWYLVAAVSDVKAVGAGLVGDVLNRAAAILVVHAGHLGLRGAFDSQAQAPRASSPSPNRQLVIPRLLTPTVAPVSVALAHLVSTVNLLGLLVVPLWMPGPWTRTREGSQPSVTGTWKGLLGTGLPS